MKEALKLALEVAEGIANADWRKWEELASPEEFERWVKSRVLHMATAIKEALAQPDAFEQGRQEGMKQERALWELSRLGQEIEAQPEQEPVGWTLTEELTKRETTTRAHLWFSNPQNCMWTPLFTSPQPERQPLTEQQQVDCLVKSGCIGTVKMSFESGPYDITRPSINASRLIEAVEAAHIGAKP